MKTAQRIIRQCVLIVLLAVALAMLFAVPDDSLHSAAWYTLFIMSKLLAIGVFAIILNPRAPWSRTRI